MEKRNLVLKFSLILNLILIIGMLSIAFKYRERIYDKITSFRNFNIVMYGNSITKQGKWNNSLKRTDIKNSGYNGYTSSQLVGNLKNAVINYKPKICFIEGSNNDIYVGISMGRIYENYETIIDTLIKCKIEPVLQSVLYINSPNDSIFNLKVDSINTFISNLAFQKGITFINLNLIMSKNTRLKKELTIDGQHLNEKGYKLWTNEIVNILIQKGI